LNATCLFTVYYRVYGRGEEIPCKKPIDSSDPNLSRINANFITPPHTPHMAGAIKHCLCSAEQILCPQWTKLFLQLSSESDLDDGTTVSLLPGMGPSYTLDDPMALVYRLPLGFDKLIRATCASSLCCSDYHI
jgi:hypothetical protein